jgi:ElaB/YqjD/DUF883 family membrane-anchored ribosome-binding protein
MNHERRLILKMLADGKLSVDEADRLLSAIDGTPAGSNGDGTKVDPTLAFLSRVAQDLQKGLNDIGAQAGGEIRKMRDRLREQSGTLRSRLEEMRKNAQPGSEKPRNHTITVEVEEEPTTTSNKNKPEEEPRHDNNG